jgi:hypothetical protein
MRLQPFPRVRALRLSAVKQRDADDVVYQAVERADSGPQRDLRGHERGTSLASHMRMTTSDRTAYVRHSGRVAVVSAALLLGASVLAAEAQQSPSSNALGRTWPSTGSWTRLGHVEHALALSEQQARNPPRPWWAPANVSHTGRHWPLRADPRRWPRLFANTTECTLSFDPVLRRHWWQ